MDIDFLKEIAADAEKLINVDDETLASISLLAKRQLQLEDFIDTLKDLKTRAEASLAEVRDRMLPDKMLEAGSKGFDLSEGGKVALSKLYLPQINVPDKPAVYEWMAKRGDAAVISAKVVIDLGKGGYERAKELQEQIGQTLGVNDVKVEGDIHWQTLRAYARELTEGKVQLPEQFKVHVIDQAKITRPKAKKSKKENDDGND